MNNIIKIYQLRAARVTILRNYFARDAKNMEFLFKDLFALRLSEIV